MMKGSMNDHCRDTCGGAFYEGVGLVSLRPLCLQLTLAAYIARLLVVAYLAS